MITVGYLKKRLEKINDDALVYAYEGEITGIIVVSKKEYKNKNMFVIDGKSHSGMERKYLATISANENGRIQDNQEII
jgi:hypothetical protein